MFPDQNIYQDPVSTNVLSNWELNLEYERTNSNTGMLARFGVRSSCANSAENAFGLYCRSKW